MAHIRQPRPDSVLGFQVKDIKIFQVVPHSLGVGSGFLVLQDLLSRKYMLVSINNDPPPPPSSPCGGWGMGCEEWGSGVVGWGTRS